MTPVVIYLKENEESCRNRLDSSGIKALWYDAFNAAEMGIHQTKFFEQDGVKCELSINNHGCTLSHWGLWRCLQHLHDDAFMILEDDVTFVADWKERLDRALVDVPNDWDILFAGSCNCTDKPRDHVKGEVWFVRWPFCTHAYIVKKKCLQTLIENCTELVNPIDVALWYDVFDSGLVKPYVILPRLSDQVDMDLMQ